MKMKEIYCYVNTDGKFRTRYDFGVVQVLQENHIKYKIEKANDEDCDYIVISKYNTIEAIHTLANHIKLIF